MTRRVAWPGGLIAGAAIGAPAIALIGGLLATTHYGKLADVAIALAVVLPLLVARFGAGVVLGLLGLGGLNALPGPNLQLQHVALTLTAQSVDVLLLIGVLFFMAPAVPEGRPRRAAVERRMLLWTGAFMLLWLFTAGRSVVASQIPIQRALYWCSDFAFFAVLIPLFARAFRDERVRQAFIGTVMIGAVVTALTQSFIVISHHQVPLLVHTVQVEAISGVPRLYTGAIDLPFAALPLALGAALFGRSPRFRLYGAITATICVVSVALALTRARYVGMTVGVAGAAVVWLCVGDTAGRLARVRFARALATIVVTAAMLVAYHPSVLGSTELTAVTSRFNSATSVVTGQSSTATIDVRLVEVRELLQYLDGRWLFGLGFLDPSSDHITGLPQGSIRNGDVGYLNVVMTMGAFGLVIYIAPLVVLALALVRWRLSRARPPSVEWMAFGGLAYLIATLISSATLVILFSTTGVVAASAVVALVVRVLAEPASATAAEPARGRALALSA